MEDQKLQTCSYKYQNLMCLPTFCPLNTIHRGSYVSAHVLLNLLNELGKWGYIVFAFSVIMFVCLSVCLSVCKLFFRQRFLSNYLG